MNTETTKQMKTFKTLGEAIRVLELKGWSRHVPSMPLLVFDKAGVSSIRHISRLGRRWVISNYIRQ